MVILQRRGDNKLLYRKEGRYIAWGVKCTLHSIWAFVSADSRVVLVVSTLNLWDGLCVGSIPRPHAPF